MKQTRKERKAKKKELEQQAIIANEVLKQLDPEQERHDRMVAAVLKAGISFKQINAGQIKVHFRGERGDEVSFAKVAPTRYRLLVEAGAIDRDYQYTIDAFFGLWRAHQIALGAWAGLLGDKNGDAMQDTLDQQRHYAGLVRYAKPVDIENMQLLSMDVDSSVDRERLLNALLPFTVQWLDTLKVMEMLIPEIPRLLEDELLKGVKND